MPSFLFIIPIQIDLVYLNLAAEDSVEDRSLRSRRSLKM